jgi:hypothetical protein
MVGTYQSLQDCVCSSCGGFNCGSTTNGSISGSLWRIPRHFHQSGSSHYGPITKGHIYSAAPVFGTFYRAYESCEWVTIVCVGKIYLLAHAIPQPCQIHELLRVRSCTQCLSVCGCALYCALCMYVMLCNDFKYPVSLGCVRYILLFAHFFRALSAVKSRVHLLGLLWDPDQEIMLYQRKRVTWPWVITLNVSN